MENRNRLKEIRFRLLMGEISYEEAKELAFPIINKMNQKAKIIAKQYGKKHKDFTFGYLMR